MAFADVPSRTCQARRRRARPRCHGRPLAEMVSPFRRQQLASRSGYIAESVCEIGCGGPPACRCSVRRRRWTHHCFFRFSGSFGRPVFGVNSIPSSATTLATRFGATSAQAWRMVSIGSESFHAGSLDCRAHRERKRISMARLIPGGDALIAPARASIACSRNRIAISASAASRRR
jgi:hypothetical protein